MIRLFLAVAVVASHTYGTLLITGAQAVEFFFVISGFLMSLILVEGAVYRKNTDFWINRTLRIFPLFLLVASTSLIMQIFVQFTGGQSSFFHVLFQTPVFGQVLLSLSNLVILGQDLVMFLDVQNGEFVLRRTFGDFTIPVHWALLVPQAWTISLELVFYLVAPFILKKMGFSFQFCLGRLC